MANNIYGFIALTGGAAGALDKIDGAALADKDMAYGCLGGCYYAYALDTDSGAAESSPDVITPDTNAGTKRWILQTKTSATNTGDETAARIAAIITGAGAIAEPLDADEFPFYKIVGTLLKKVTWANIKATLKASGAEVLAGTSDAKFVTPLGITPILPNRNGLINGSMRVSQRGTSFTSATVPANSDDTYLLDRWILLSDGNDIVDVTQVTTPVPTGQYAAACFDIETEDKKWGILQVLEARDSARFIGGTVSLSFQARRGAGDTSTLLRAAVLSWSSTTDTVTSDIVDAWGNEGTNPTLVANWTFENVPAALAELTDSYQTFKIEGISIDTASTTNIAVFIWSDDKTNAVGDLVYITGAQLELSSVATPFEARPYQQELALCQRYFYKESSDATATYKLFGLGNCPLTTAAYITKTLPVTMRVVPTLSYSTLATTLTVDDINLAKIALSALIIQSACSDTSILRLDATVAGGLTVGAMTVMMAANTDTAWLGFSAEL